MGELVDERHLGMPSEDGLKVHFLEECPPIFDGSARHNLETRDQLLGMQPSVGLHEANDDISTPLASPVTLVEHGVGLPDTRSCAQVYAEVASCLDPVGSVLGRGRLGERRCRVDRRVCHCDPEPPLTVVMARAEVRIATIPAANSTNVVPKPPPFTPF